MDKIIVVCGATGSGKTKLSIEIAKKYNGEVVSADSISIYKYLNIGSAKPTKEEMKGIKHHLIDVVCPTDEFSVSQYEEYALSTIKDILSRGKLPIICGGTGFYINSILFNLSYGNAPKNDDVRQKYENYLKYNGKEKLFDLLREVDYETSLKLHTNDTMRVIRALEIFECSGVKKSQIKDEVKPRFDYIAFMPNFEREKLYNLINARVDRMFDNGLENEVKCLLNQGITLENQCMQGIGYKETASAILKNEEMPIELIKLNSRHYAKRQITFFKRYDNLIYYNPLEENYFDNITHLIDDFLQK